MSNNDGSQDIDEYVSSYNKSNLLTREQRRKKRQSQISYVGHKHGIKNVSWIRFSTLFRKELVLGVLLMRHSFTVVPIFHQCATCRATSFLQICGEQICQWQLCLRGLPSIIKCLAMKIDSVRNPFVLFIALEMSKTWDLWILRVSYQT